MEKALLRIKLSERGLNNSYGQYGDGIDDREEVIQAAAGSIVDIRMK